MKNAALSTLGIPALLPLLVACGSNDSSVPAPLPALEASTESSSVAEAGPDSSPDQSSQDASPDDTSTNPESTIGPEAPFDAPLEDVTLEADVSSQVPDPAQDGPYTYQEQDGLVGTAAVHCAVPTAGPSPAPYPLVLFAHGFMIEPFRYYGYVKRLATFGYVACTVGYSSLSGQDQDPTTIVATLDWALAESAKSSGALAGKVDTKLAGVAGHSRGGKAAINAAAQEKRFLAVFGLDPVNTCPLGSCPNALAAAATLTIPSGFLGETLDDGDAGGAQPCAPAGDNFQQFYAASPSPSFSLNVLGANHMSFVDDTTGCLQCGLCKEATVDREDVLEIAHAYTVAFFERRLRGNVGYDTYLTGAAATQRYVQTNRAIIESK